MHMLAVFCNCDNSLNVLTHKNRNSHTDLLKWPFRDTDSAHYSQHTYLLIRVILLLGQQCWRTANVLTTTHHSLYQIAVND